MKNTKVAKKFMSIMVALALVLTLIPAGIGVVRAADASKFLAPIGAPAAGSIAISSAGGLDAIRYDSDSLSKSYYLTADIDLSGWDWTPIGTSLPFTGTFDGQGYVIKNLKITMSYQYVGLFGYIHRRQRQGGHERCYAYIPLCARAQHRAVTWRPA